MLPTEMPAEAVEENQVNLTLSRETFELAKGFIAGLGQAIQAADAQIKAEEKAMKASATMDQVMADGQELAGFGQELSAMSDAGLGLPRM